MVIMAYVPQSIGEVLAYLSHMMLASPTFKDKTGYLPKENIDTTFFPEPGTAGRPQEARRRTLRDA